MVVATMSDSDALLWNVGRDPLLRMTITGLMVLPAPPSMEEVAAGLEGLSRAVPKFRSRVEEPPPWGGGPRWVEDPNFDLGFHLRRLGVPAPADLGALLGVAAPIAMTDFDPARSPWEVTLFDDLWGGRSAVLIKVHHAITDGLGGVQLLTELLGAAPGGRERRARAATLPARGPGAYLGRTLRASLEGTRRLLHALGEPAEAGKALGGAADTLGSVAQLLAPAGSPQSLLMRPRSPSWAFGVMDLPVHVLHSVARSFGVTLNDAFVCAVLGGLRHYHLRHGSAVERLRVNMPVSSRSADDLPGGNRFTPVRFLLPASEPDPERRARQVASITAPWKAPHALALSDMMASALNRLPAPAVRSIFGSMLKGVDFVATNVGGCEQAVSFGGVPVERLYAFGPPSGAAVSVAMFTYAGTAWIGVNADAAAVPDLEQLLDCLRQGFDELSPPRQPLPRRAPRSEAVAGAAHRVARHGDGPAP